MPKIQENFFAGKKRRTGSNLAFNDLLFNVLIGFVMLFVIAFLLINPIAKKADIPVKAEFMVVLEWDPESSTDLDIWVQLNNDKPVGFSNRENTPLHLDRDDLGTSNDKITIDGQDVFLRTNRETITLRGIVPGDYYVAVHAYSKRQSEAVVPYTVTVMKVNAFRQLYSIQGEFIVNREIQRLPGFSVDGKGNVKSIFKHVRDVVPTRGTGVGQ